MQIYPESIFNLLQSMPGNLAYYLILIYAITASFLAVMNGYRAGQYPVPIRTFGGLAALVGAVILPAVILILNILGSSASNTTYPVLERISLSWIMVWVAWLWLGSRKSTILDISVLALSVLFPTLLIIITNYFPLNGIPFNASPADIIWHFMVVLTTLIFTVILIRKKSQIGSYGIGMMLLILTGFTISLIYLTPVGEISGAARLGILCAIPLLPALVQQFESSAPTPKPISDFDAIMSQTIVQPIPDQINTWLDAVGNSNLTRQQGEIAKILCQTFDANACVFLQISERPGILHLTSGYDYTKKTWIESKDLSTDGLPRTLISVKNSVPAVLKKSRESLSETSKFSDWLQLGDITSMAILPVRDTTIQWGAAALFRASTAAFFEEDDLLPYLRTMVSLTNIFKDKEISHKEKLDAAKLSSEINILQEKNHVLQTKLDALRLSTVQVWPDADINQALNLQQASQSEIDRIRNENQILLQALADEREILKFGHSGTHPADVDEELESAKTDLTKLQSLLKDSHQKIEELEKRTTFSSTTIERLRKFSTLTTQIRNPVAAITGYIDVLLTENASPSAKLDDRTTLENLNTSLSKLRQIMDEMAEINVLESGVIDMEPESMDMNSAIDQAVSRVTPFLSEKGISLKLSLPEVLPVMKTYHEALQKVIIHLLYNAGKATPTNGTVELMAKVHEEGTEPYFLLEITDSGGGVASQDINKIFHPDDQNIERIIHGLGETSEGLLTARTLIEAHGGRIWVDSNPGFTTSFSVLLPIESDKPGNGQPVK